MPPFGCNCCAVCDDGQGSVRKYSADGVLLWSRDHGATIRDVAINESTGAVYAVGDTSTIDGMTTRAYDRDGCDLWSDDHGDQVNRVTVADDSTIITVGNGVDAITRVPDPSFGIQARRYNAAGVQQWQIINDEFNHGAFNVDVVEDSGKFWILTGFANVGFPIARQFNTDDGTSTGVSVSRSDPPAINPVDEYAIDLDTTGDIHIGGKRQAVLGIPNSWPMAKYDENGVLVWRSEDFYPAGGMRDLRVTDSQIWTAGVEIRLARFELDGSIDQADVPFFVVAAVSSHHRIDARDESGSNSVVYVTEGDKLYKHDAGDLSETWNVDHGGAVIACDAGSDGLIDCVIIGGVRVLP